MGARGGLAAWLVPAWLALVGPLTGSLAGSWLALLALWLAPWLALLPGLPAASLGAFLGPSWPLENGPVHAEPENRIFT